MGKGIISNTSRSSISNRLTDPFNEKVRARIFDTYTSSAGSDHDAESDVVSSSSSFSSPSLCLSYLVQNFLEDDSTVACDFDRNLDSDSDSEGAFLRSDTTAVIRDVINPTVRNNVDPFRNQLLMNVNRAVEIFAKFRKNRSIYNRNLMAYFRQIGYNAGVCKTQWDSSGGLSGGSYEFIDVIRPDSSLSPVRYLVDVDFAGEFEIARETVNYAKIRSSLPRVFAGKSDDLKRIVRVMCDEARRSMKINGLSLPPWRKNRYMQVKWLGSYHRTINHLPASAPVIPTLAVQCRFVGFEVAGDGNGLYVPPTTRTK